MVAFEPYKYFPYKHDIIEKSVSKQKYFCFSNAISLFENPVEHFNEEST